MLLARVNLARGNLALAQDRLKTYVAGLPDGASLREIRCEQAQAALRAGEVSALGGWLTALASPDPALLSVQREREAFTLARLHLAQARPAEARALLDPWRATAAEQGRVRSAAEAACLEALACHVVGDEAQARLALSEALAIGQEKGFCRLFLDEGASLDVLLHDWLPVAPNRALSLYATTLLHALAPAGVSPSQSPAAPPALIEPLSKQEIRVLRLIVAGLTNADIGRELVVSPNTVKTHVRNVYRKLGVNNRDEAVVVARQLKLL